jgi:hypothetical protein
MYGKHDIKLHFSLFYFEWGWKLNGVDCGNDGKSKGWWKNIGEPERKRRAGKKILLEDRWEK